MNIFENAQNIVKLVHEMSPEVTIIGASKTRSPEEIEQAKKGGIEIMGENRVQELVEKFGKADVVWHFIGHLQTNKVNKVVGKVDLIHSVDSQKLAKEIDKQAKKLNIMQKILLEVNVGEEQSKSGVTLFELNDLYEFCKTLENVSVTGLMSVMPKDADEKLYLLIKQEYDKLKKADENISMLSVGMSNDFERAIKCGANMVRIGSKLFGQRNYQREET